MSYELQWLVPNRILSYQFPPVFDELIAHQYDLDVISYLDHAEGKIHIVADLREVQVHPPLRTITSWKHVRHPMLGYAATVGLTSNALMRMVASIMIGITHIQTKDFSTVDEAVSFLEKLNREVN